MAVEMAKKLTTVPMNPQAATRFWKKNMRQNKICHE
jgi:hypothetical protein